jgi:hypothetical protein
VRVRTSSIRSSCAWPVGFGSQVHDTMEGVLGLLPVLLSPAGRRRVLWLAGQFHITIREERDAGQHIGRTSDSDSGVPAGDEGNVRGRRDSVKARQGTEKAHGESASSALKRRRSRGAPERDRLKLATRIASSTLLFPDHANGRGRREGTQ